MTKYTPRHAKKRVKSNKGKLILATGLISTTVLSTVSPVLADSVTNEQAQNTTVAKPVEQNIDKVVAETVTGYAQYGTLKIDLQDSTGYIYKAGTQVARQAQSLNGGTGNYWMSLSLAAYPGSIQSFGFGQVPEQYVTAGSSKSFDIDPSGDSVWVNTSYVTDTGKYETLTPAGQVDKTALVKAISDGQSYIDKESEYTADSIANLKSAISNGRSINANDGATQSDVDAATTAINNAIAALVKVTPNQVDKTALVKAISDGQSYIDKSSEYTDDSIANLKAAMAAAQSVNNDKNATQAQVDAATKALSDAIAALVEKPDTPVDVNKDNLESAINNANDSLNNSDKYTDDSVNALNDALSKAQSVYNDKNATQAQVDAATKALNDAIAALVEKPEDGGNTNTPGDNNGSNSNGNSDNGSNENSNPGSSSNQTNDVDKKENNSKETLPQTGDTKNSIAISIMGLLLSVLGMLGSINKRKNI
ncbi:hypothetical protein RD055328_10900 [Companilactobacillus sp. RD055328]|uniref:LPXTG cell wall anchor domain-containing protein n=1 Tax=Companilactobacillus sp. RD055328 TaxID=2916634 RepID=UPI001FC84492|nr:LPXTG cell wall anchor domain-containing protein [Companilactobacillus sp. RD055328]GKQ43167.1 hypothetical protein RD055328_10900 [Companilactobacillus sp. RD055328]